MRGVEKGTICRGICQTCGREFSYTYDGHKLTVCDDCSYTRGLMKTHPFKGMGTERRKKRKPHLTDINAAARAAGMTYGQYQAFLYFKKKKEGKVK